MSEPSLENELTKLRQEYEKEGASPELLVRARALVVRCQQVQCDATDLVVEVVRRSPVRLSLRAILRSQESGLPAQVTSDIVADLKRTIDRIDAAEINLLMGLGEIAQRVAHEESVYGKGMSQVHSKFKVFISTPVEGKLDPAIAAEVSKFFSDHQDTLIPKSVGIEYLEQTNNLVLSIGYVEGKHDSTVKLDCVSLGNLALDAKVIEEALAAAASKVPNVICHEFYVDDGHFFLVLLSLT